MDADTKFFLQQMSERVTADIVKLEVKLDKMHTPLDCAIAERVRELELREANQRGVMTVIGAIAGLVASTIVAVLATVFKR